jgi:ankyrin repeat protein
MIKEAAGGGSKRMMELLLLRNQNTEITEEFFEAAAVNQKAAEIIPILLEYNGQIRLSEKVVKLAARQNCKKVVEMLFARAADVRAAELLLGAAENLGYGLEVMDFLLAQDERLSITEEVLKAAAGNFQFGKDLVDLLLNYDRGATLTEKVAIAAARHAMRRDTLAFLLHRDPKLPITEQVWKAAAANSSDVIQFLLDRGSDIYVTEDVLEAAARNGCCNNVQLLLQHSSTRTSSSTDWTSIAEFINNSGPHGHLSELQRLLAAGVDPEKKDDEGRTPLAVACLWDREDIVKLLLESGKVDLESRSNYGETPLFFAEAAVGGRSEAVVRLLLEAGANPDARNAYGRTRLEMTDEDRDRIDRS